MLATVPVRRARRLCIVDGCGAFAVDRGHCPRHPRLASTTARGYGAEHQAERAAALPGARCFWCGKTADQAAAEGKPLRRDHIVPRSMGGTDDPSNKRWGCSSCHARHGAQSNRRNES